MTRQLTPWNPFRELARFRPWFDADEFWKEFGVRPVWGGFETEPQIKVDVSEDDGSYMVKAEIPGVKKEDIDVSIDGDTVSISAEVKKEKEEKEGKRVVRSERYSGSVYRSFTLDSEVDDAKAEATYADGLLTLRLPKKAGTAAKKLTVS
jgi:HSP20 family protein